MLQKSNPFRQRSHGGGNCSDDGGAHEGEPALHPTHYFGIFVYTY